jgi:hypothetical protein
MHFKVAAGQVNMKIYFYIYILFINCLINYFPYFKLPPWVDVNVTQTEMKLDENTLMGKIMTSLANCFNFR